MPIAKVYLPENILTPEQRREIVKGIHEVILTVEKAATWLADLRADQPSPSRRLGFQRQAATSNRRASSCPARS